MQNVQSTQQNQSQTSIRSKKNKWWLWLLAGCGVLVILGMILFVAGCFSVQKKTAEVPMPTEKEKSFSEVATFTGNQSRKFEEFIITSKEVKFVYQCDEGPFVCVGWLTQVGDKKQELFRSRGGTGILSEQKILSIGPGTFYIEIDTDDRTYKIDVFQNVTPATTEEMSSAQTMEDESQKYRSVNGFRLIDENIVSGVLIYYYETNDGMYRVNLQVDPTVTDFELEEDYTLKKTSLKIDNIDIQYAFNKGSDVKGVVFFKPYEDMEFTFVANNKTHVGFVRRIDKKDDRLGITSTLKYFLNALVPNIEE